MEQTSFIKIYDWMTNFEFDGTDALIYARIFSYFQADKEYFGSVEVLAAGAFTNSKTAYRRLKAMIDKGYLLSRTEKNANGRKNIYTINPEKLPPEFRKTAAPEIPIDYADIAKKWNTIVCDGTEVKRLTAITGKRAEATRQAVQKLHELGATFGDMADIISQSDFLLGNTSGFKVTYDWAIKPANLKKIMEGKYNANTAIPTYSTPTAPIQPEPSPTGRTVIRIGGDLTEEEIEFYSNPDNDIPIDYDDGYG